MKNFNKIFRVMFVSAIATQHQYAIAASPKNDQQYDITYSHPTALVMSPVDAVSQPSQDPKKQLSFLYAGISPTITNLQDPNLNNVLDECFPSSGSNPKSAFIGGVLAYLAPKLVGLFIKEVDKGLEKELEKYSQTHKKSVSISPYKSNLEFKSPCFRYTRFTEIKRTEKTTKKVSSTRNVEFDFIGQWRIADNQYTQVRPLRLYMRTPSVPNDADLVSIALSTKVNGVWRNSNEGRSAEIFHAIVLKEKIKKPAGLKNKRVDQVSATQGWTKGLHYYDLNDDYSWEKIEALPIIPYSEGHSPDSAIAKLEISVAEVGDGKRKKTLKFLSKSLKLFEDDLTSVLEEAAKGIFEKEAPEVDDTQYFCATFTSSPSSEEGVVGHIEWDDSGDQCPDPL